MESQSERLQQIAHEMIEMAEVDQAMRHSGTWDASVDQKNTARMKEIVAEIGWPTISKVGPQGASVAWLLVQHAVHDREFQNSCLALMKAEPVDEVEPRHIAYLEDRIRVFEQRPQLYGTQFHTDTNGELVPFPIEDPEHVDQRRAEVGLGTFASYAALVRSNWQEKQSRER